MRILQIIGCGLALLMLIVSTVFGLLPNYLIAFLLLSALCLCATSVVFVARRRFGSQPVPLGRRGSQRRLSRRRVLRSATWISIGFCIHVAVAPVQFSPFEYRSTLVLVWGMVAVLCLLDWIPRRPIGLVLDSTLAVFLILLVYQLSTSYWPGSLVDAVELQSPLSEEWIVLQGGGSALLNHHHFAGSQKHAIDLVPRADGRLPLEGVSSLDRYAAFGAPLFSPVAGKIVSTDDSLPDQRPGESDYRTIVGNHVVVRADDGFFVLMAHLQKGSVQVSVGELVEVGQELAKVGNSGNTSQPHLHVQAMTHARLNHADNQPLAMLFDVNDRKRRWLKRNDMLPASGG